MKIIATQLGENNQRIKGLIDFPELEPVGPSQVKTKTLYSGVTNGTERNDLLRGNYSRPDSDLPAGWGYQNVGEVVEVGTDVTRLAVGDVVYSSFDHYEYAVFDENFLYCKLSDAVERKEAALFGMTSVAMRTCRHADIRMGERVLVVGAGIIGQTAAQIANIMGARVTICDINEERLELAHSIDAAEKVYNVRGDNWQQYIKDFAYDVIIDMAGVPGMEDKLVAAAAPRGRIMFIAGRKRVDYEFNYGQGHEITIKQNSHFDNDDLANLCRLVEKGQVKIKPYIKDIVPVTEAYGIYEKLRDEPNKLLGTVFDWQNL
jgi:2-desacetyl-2-hydroxyethyl bacteriochlorophyllide A dehydrogenase